MPQRICSGRPCAVFREARSREGWTARSPRHVETQLRNGSPRAVPIPGLAGRTRAGRPRRPLSARAGPGRLRPLHRKSHPKPALQSRRREPVNTSEDSQCLARPKRTGHLWSAAKTNFWNNEAAVSPPAALRSEARPAPSWPLVTVRGRTAGRRNQPIGSSSGENKGNRKRPRGQPAPFRPQSEDTDQPPPPSDSGGGVRAWPELGLHLEGPELDARPLWDPAG